MAPEIPCCFLTWALEFPVEAAGTGTFTVPVGPGAPTVFFGKWLWCESYPTRHPNDKS